MELPEGDSFNEYHKTYLKQKKKKIIIYSYKPFSWPYEFSYQNAKQYFYRNRKRLTHCSLETPKSVFSKQCKPRSDAAECGIWSGSPLFANSSTILL